MGDGTENVQMPRDLLNRLVEGIEKVATANAEREALSDVVGDIGEDVREIKKYIQGDPTQLGMMARLADVEKQLATLRKIGWMLLAAVLSLGGKVVYDTFFTPEPAHAVVSAEDRDD